MDFLMDFAIVEDEQKKRLSATPPPPAAVSASPPAARPTVTSPTLPTQTQPKANPSVATVASPVPAAAPTVTSIASSTVATKPPSPAPSSASSTAKSSVAMTPITNGSTNKTAPVVASTLPSSSSTASSSTSNSSVPAPKPAAAGSSVASSSSSTSSASSASGTASMWLTLLRIRECFIYAVPPRVGLTPYHAEGWGLDKPINTGELHVVAQEGTLLIRFYDQKSHALFAQTVELNCLEFQKNSALSLDSFIEPVRDSSRYFVVRIKDPHRGAITSIGIGFRERVSAFDLSAAIADRIKTVGRHYSDGTDAALDAASAAERERKEIELAEQRLAQNHQDLSLKQGQRITVALKSMSVGGPGGPGGDQKPKKKSTTGGISLVASGSGFILAPPPAALDANAGIDQPSLSPEGVNLSAAPSAANLSPNQAPVAASAANEPPDFELHRVRAGDEEGDSERALEGQGEHQPPLEGHPAPVDPNDDEDEFTDFASAN